MVRFLISTALVLLTAPVMAEGEPWINDPAKAMEIAQATGRPVLLHFWNEQCPPCRRVETFVFTNGQVIESLSRNFVSVKVNTTERPDLVKRYHVERIPQDVVVLPNGQVVSQVQSPLNSRSYLAMLDQVSADAGKPHAGSEIALARALAYNETSDPNDSVPVQGQPGTQPGSAARPHASVPTSAVPTATHRRFSDSSSSSPVPQGNTAVAQGSEQGSYQGVVQAAPSAPVQRPVANSAAMPFASSQQANPTTQPSPTVQVSNPYATRQVSGTDETVPAGASGVRPSLPISAGSNAAENPARGVSGGGAFRPPGSSAAPAPMSQPSANPATVAPSQGPLGGPLGVNLGTQPQGPQSQGSQAQGSQAQGSPAQGTQAPIGNPANPARVAAVPQWSPSEQNPARPPLNANGFGAQPNLPPAMPNAPPQAPMQNPEVPQAEPQPQGPSLGLQGFCPVALVRDRVWQEGNQAYGCIHRGRLYLFCCPGHRDEFLKTPDEFAPVLSGFDPVIFAEERRLVEGKREHGAFVDDRIILFANEETFQKFTKDSLPYIRAVQQAMAASDSVRR